MKRALIIAVEVLGALALAVAVNAGVEALAARIAAKVAPAGRCRCVCKTGPGSDVFWLESDVVEGSW